MARSKLTNSFVDWATFAVWAGFVAVVIGTVVYAAVLTDILSGIVATILSGGDLLLLILHTTVFLFLCGLFYQVMLRSNTAQWD
jgi:amino acid permease